MVDPFNYAKAIYRLDKHREKEWWTSCGNGESFGPPRAVIGHNRSLKSHKTMWRVLITLILLAFADGLGGTYLEFPPKISASPIQGIRIMC